ncbi:hypothetical protein [Paenibacillus sp. YYML68]|uniref:hypothetical protein n=1 Tax=Paenibacillus sp. YYML68 TaxID=2909250 RepID=UPI00249204D0|nr:hypothetical protein [Paenibacillus sp. YYML68]
MSYNPQVVEAKIVSSNPNNGLYEIVAQLKDRTVCRITFEKDEAGSTRVTNINRLLKEPCPICRKDFLCNCMTRFKETIFDQAIEKVELPQA